jgi:secretion/DNA translocation related TadE-like protein
VKSEAGVATILIVCLSAVTVLMSMALASVVVVTRIHASVDTSADLAALAAANRLLLDANPCLAARKVAERNKTLLDRCVITGATVAVVVSRPLPASIAAFAHLDRAVGRAYAALVVDPSLLP